MSWSGLMRTRRWQKWCDSDMLYCGVEYVKRKHLILELARDGIVPFLKKNGYELGCSEHRLAECIARSLYFGKTSHEPLNYDYREEDYYHYYYVLDADKWNMFWSKWGNWSDIDEDSATNRAGIEFCVWTLLDLYKSTQTAVVDDMLGLNEEENEHTDTRDPYLVDSANGFFSSI